MARKSLIAPTVFTLAGLVLLLGLGTWQVQRLHWKEGLIAERQAAVAAPATPLPASLAAAQQLEFRHVAVTGRFHNDRELYVFATAKRDGAIGFHVITPLERSDGTVVLVDRGFVPNDRKAPETRTGSQSSSAITVTGLLRLPAAGKPNWFTPDNRPDRNDWYYVDLPAMAAAVGLGPVLPFYVDADATPGGAYPEGGQTPLDLPNNHLQYAITWYALAVTLLAFYIVLVRRHRREAAP